MFIKPRHAVASVFGSICNGGGLSARKTSEIEVIFQDISKDLNQTYMLDYSAPPPKNYGWRTIQLIVKGLKGYKIRAKEGYEPE